MPNRRAVVASIAALTVFAGPSWAQSYGTSAGEVALETVASGLDHPWGLEFLPDGRAIVTERPGRIRIVGMDGKLSEPLPGGPEVYAEGQGGLLDVALHPQFEQNRLVYFSFAEARDGGNGTSVARATLNPEATSLDGLEIIFRQMPAFQSDSHFGSRLVFDRAGNLFVTMGDRYALRDQAQNPGNHIGKIVRITDSGGIPADNPKIEGWLPDIWSIGHRNVQGATLHPDTGQLWTAEHGARGGDEINTPQAGRNYGWPVITYGRDYSGAKIGEGTAKEGLEQPVYYWDPSIAPSGMTFYTGDRFPAWRGNLFVGALAGMHVARLTIEDGKVVGEETLFQDIGRVRDVKQGPDGWLYLLTDNGEPDGSLIRARMK